MKLLWTPRDLDILDTLAHRVRLLAFDQVMRLWWPTGGNPRVVRRRLRKLVNAGLIEAIHQCLSPLA